MTRERPTSAPAACRRQMARRRGLAVVVAAVAAETAVVWRRAGRPGGWLVVRCRDGHRFTTLWIPGVSVKSVRLGLWRLQRCPVGRHVTLVTPERPAALDDKQRSAALAIRDVRLP